MILAAPLVIPFAEAIGVSIAALGMAKATDKVNEFIQENPEQSIKIFQMIMPSQGIANALKNKSSEGDEDLSEDMDEEVEEKPKLTGKDKSEKIKAAIRRARAGKGNYSSPDAEGSAVDIRGSVIREAEDMGLADKDLKDKPYKEKGYDFRDYIPRGAYKKRYADGGAIGIEVLFGEKNPRQGLFMGGPALTGPALNIFNSMKAYQSFTDQEIANAIKEAGYELPTADSGTTPPPAPGDSTPGSSQPSGNNDGRAAPPVGSVSGGSGLIGDYMTAIEGRQDRLTNPNVPTSFISSLAGGGQRDINEMIRTGQVDTRKTSGIPLGIGSILSQILPDKYYDMSLADQVFTQSQMGYTGPTVFGENLTGNYKDLFGLNIRSAFGNPAEAVGKNFNQLRDTLTKDREGVTFNEETGMFEGVNADAVNKQTEMIRNKYNFRKQQLGLKNVFDSQIKSADVQREKERLDAIKIEAANREAAREAARIEAARQSAIAQEAANREAAREAARIEAARQSAIAQEAANREAAREAARIEAARQSAIAQEAANREAAREAARIEAARKSAIAQEAANREAAREAARIEAARKSAIAQEAAKQRELQIQAAAKAQEISRSQAREQQAAIERDQQRDRDRGGAGSGGGGVSASGAGSGGGYNQGNFCFDPNTPIQMADGSEKKIKDIQLGDDTKGGEVTGIFQFKAADEIHDYKGVTVAGSHYVKEDGKFIMVKDSPLSIKIDKIPVVYSLDTSDRRIFINNIEFADYNGDGVAKNFLTNAGVDLTGFDTEVLRQVENRLI
jgi:hypothetical protein